MEKKATSGIVLILLASMLTLGFNIQPVRAQGTIYIRADGSVDPPTAPIQRDGDVYTLTANIYGAHPDYFSPRALVVERSDIVIDGAGYTVQGTDSGTELPTYAELGILLEAEKNVTLKNTQVKNFTVGIYVYCQHAFIIGNNISDCYDGIDLLYPTLENLISGNNITDNTRVGVWCPSGWSSINNTIYGNNITDNGIGINIYVSNNNTISENVIIGNSIGIDFNDSTDTVISGNTIANNEDYGIEFLYEFAYNNTIYHNNFENNTVQAHAPFGSGNAWDDGYLSGGNYWSDYEEKYPDAEELDGSGIWDTPYVLNANNRDRYPLVSSWPPPEHELLTSIKAPSSITLGGSSLLNATTTNRGSSDETSVEFLLLINGTTVNSTTISLLQAGDSYTLRYLWTPTTEGAYNVTAYAHSMPGEASLENNQMTKFVTVAVSAPPEAEVGVKAGGWIKYTYTISGWPVGTPYPEWLKVEFTSAEGTTATVRVTMRMSNGTELSETVPVDVVAGGQAFGLSGFVIPVNSTVGDSAIMGSAGFTFNVTIDGENTRTYVGASRTVVYASFSQLGSQLTYYWDKQTGVMVEASTTSGSITVTAKATETNMWEAASSPFWTQGWFYTIVAAIIVALTGTVYFLKKRKPPTPSQTPAVPPPPTEGT